MALGDTGGGGENAGSDEEDTDRVCLAPAAALRGRTGPPAAALASRTALALALMVSMVASSAIFASHCELFQCHPPTVGSH